MGETNTPRTKKKKYFHMTIGRIKLSLLAGIYCIRSSGGTVMSPLSSYHSFRKFGFLFEHFHVLLHLSVDIAIDFCPIEKLQSESRVSNGNPKLEGFTWRLEFIFSSYGLSH